MIRVFLTQLAIKLQFSFPPYPTFVFTLPGENTTSEISLFYSMQYDCLIYITHFVHFFGPLNNVGLLINNTKNYSSCYKTSPVCTTGFYIDM